MSIIIERLNEELGIDSVWDDPRTGAIYVPVTSGVNIIISEPHTVAELVGEDLGHYLVQVEDDFGNPVSNQHSPTTEDDTVEVVADLYTKHLLGVVEEVQL